MVNDGPSIETSSEKMMLIREPSSNTPSMMGLLSDTGRPMRSDMARKVAREQFSLTEPDVGRDHAEHLVVHVNVFETNRVNILKHFVGEQRFQRSVSNQITNHDVSQALSLGLD